MQSRQLWLDLEWTPRESNTEADARTHEEFDGFDLARRIEVDLQSLPYQVMKKFLERGKELYNTLETLKRARQAGQAPGGTESGRRKRRARREGLKETDPWT